jgi:hypothetical protein
MLSDLLWSMCAGSAVVAQHSRVQRCPTQSRHPGCVWGAHQRSPPAKRNFVVSASLLRGRYRGAARLIHIIPAMTQAYRHLSHTAPIFASLALVIFEELTVACLQWSGDLPLGAGCVASL